MRGEREKALSLRLQGYSYNEITAQISVPKSTLSSWFTGLVLSNKAQLRLKERVRERSLAGLVTKNRLQTHQARQRARNIRDEASNEIKTISERELLLIGSALYWAEGYKKPIIRNGQERTYHRISLPNTDPVMVKVFLKFLTKTLGIPIKNITASIRIFEHINEQEALKYWQEVSGIPRKNFRKSYYGVSKSSLHKRPYNRLPYGTIQVTVGDTKNFHRIMGWIEGIGKVLS